jgi:hypothetical protein
MKTRCIFFIFFIIQINIFAQDIKTEIGARTGVNVSNFNGYSGYFGNRAGIYAGFYIKKHLSERSSINIEPSYSQKGAIIYIYTPEKINVKVNSTLHYIDIPILFNYRAVKNLYLFAGPQFNILLAETAKAKQEGATAKIKGGSPLELAFAGGIGYKIFPRFFIEARYSRGVLSIINNSSTPSHALQGGIGYRLYKE